MVSGFTKDVMSQWQVFLDAGPGIEQTTNLERKVATENTENTEKQSEQRKTNPTASSDP